MTTTENSTLDGRIREIIARVFEVAAEDVGDETRFVEDFGGDSMVTLELLSELEREFGVTIPEESLPAMVHLSGVRRVLVDASSS